MRPNGFYWVRFRGQWTIGHYAYFGAWFLFYEPVLIREADLDEIGGLITRPNEKNNDYKENT